MIDTIKIDNGPTLYLYNDKRRHSTFFEIVTKYGGMNKDFISNNKEYHMQDGVAHILEHTTLCGSKKYPVRDPFFNMIKRSLNTYMNAWTAPDYTSYPFSTQNEKDFTNLLSVYLDATFFPNLEKFDFLQEGHRLEFDKKEGRKEGFKG